MSTTGHDGHEQGDDDGSTMGAATAVLEMGGSHWASEKAVVERMLGRVAGVHAVEANPVAQTATVSYDPSATNVGELRRWIAERLPAADVANTGNGATAAAPSNRNDVADPSRVEA